MTAKERAIIQRCLARAMRRAAERQRETAAWMRRTIARSR
jgi:hypothetical protein